MREFKFRAWDKELCVMRYFYPPDYSYGIIHLRNIFTNTALMPMQYTGLKDKNGKEIYEGDIVLACTENTPSKYVIKYDSASMGFVLDTTEYTITIDDVNHCGRDIEVIGNIYENPELLGSL
jgi:uncharacterized phage protein (TIGR01671 family)